MTFQHIIVWLKNDNQKGSIPHRMGQWKQLDEAVGEWKQTCPAESHLYLTTVWGSAEGKKVPFFCVKKGLLRGVFHLGKTAYPLKDVSIPCLEPLPTKYQSYFSHSSNGNSLLLQELKSHTSSYGELLPYINDTSWSFQKDGWIEALSRLAASYQKVFETVIAWHKENQRGILTPKEKKHIISTTQKIKAYRKHVTVCAKEEPSLSVQPKNRIQCTRCSSEWQLEGEEMAFPSQLYLMERKWEEALTLYHEREALRRKMTTSIQTLQHKFRFVDWKDVHALRHLFLALWQSCEDEDITLPEVEAGKKGLQQLVSYQHLLDGDFNGEWQNRYAIERMQQLVQELLVDRKIPRTNMAYHKRVVIWKEALDKGKNEWEQRMKETVKEMPMQYAFSSLTVSFADTQTVLETVQKMDGDYGLHTIADMLRGAKTQKMREHHLTKNPSYGQLSAYKKTDVVALLEGMIQKGWLERIGYEYPKLHLTKKGVKQLERMNMKEKWLKTDNSAISEWRASFLKEDIETFIQSLSNDEIALEWKISYMDNWFKRDGFVCYQRLLTLYKEDKTTPLVVADFLAENYHERYEPIYLFYQKTAGKTHPALSTLCDSVLTAQPSKQIS